MLASLAPGRRITHRIFVAQLAPEAEVVVFSGSKRAVATFENAYLQSLPPSGLVVLYVTSSSRSPTVALLRVLAAIPQLGFTLSDPPTPYPRYAFRRRRRHHDTR